MSDRIAKTEGMVIKKIMRLDLEIGRGEFW